MQQIEFTRYAEFQVQERKIKKRDILDTLESPGQLLLGKKGRKIAQRKFDKEGEKGLLRVIFEEKADAKIVITSYWTSKIKKYWDSGGKYEIKV